MISATCKILTLVADLFSNTRVGCRGGVITLQIVNGVKESHCTTALRTSLQALTLEVLLHFLYQFGLLARRILAP